MASPIFTPPTTTLKQTFAENTNSEEGGSDISAQKITVNCIFLMLKWLKVTNRVKISF